jgi:hypothetical protein
MSLKKPTRRAAGRGVSPAQASKISASDLVRGLFADSPEPSFNVTVQVGRAKRSFACEAKSDRGARQKAMKYYRGMYPDRECKVVASARL